MATSIPVKAFVVRRGARVHRLGIVTATDERAGRVLVYWDRTPRSLRHPTAWESVGDLQQTDALGVPLPQQPAGLGE